MHTICMVVVYGTGPVLQKRAAHLEMEADEKNKTCRRPANRSVQDYVPLLVRARNSLVVKGRAAKLSREY